MATVKPFKGLRPTVELASRVAAPPYDVLNSEEARQMASGNPYSFLHVGKPEIDLPAGVHLYDDSVYAKGAENFRRMIHDGILVQDQQPCFYVYRQRMGTHIQTGLAACASVDDYDKNVIKKHELTRQDKEDDRTRHIQELNSQTGPVFLTYPAVPKLDQLMSDAAKAAPTYHFTSDDAIEHTFWVVEDPTWINAVVDAFATIPYLYVADGHHRSAAASRNRQNKMKQNPSHTGQEEYNFFYTVIFPHNQMQIMDYNRVVKDLHGHTVDSFKEAVGKVFEIKETCEAKPGKLHDFGMFLDGQWYRLTAKPGTFNANDPIESLDVSILQENLLAPLLGIGDPRKDKRVDFVGGIRGMAELERLVNTGGFKVAFSLFPTSIDQLMAIADAGKIMPPKSTWFEPKLKDGLVCHMLD